MFFSITDYVTKFVELVLTFVILLLVSKPKDFKRSELFFWTTISVTVCFSIEWILTRWIQYTVYFVLLRFLLLFLSSRILCNGSLSLGWMSSCFAVFISLAVQTMILFTCAIWIGRSQSLVLSMSMILYPGVYRAIFLGISLIIQGLIILVIRHISYRLVSMNEFFQWMLGGFLLLASVLIYLVLGMIDSWRTVVWQTATVLSWIFIFLSAVGMIGVFSVISILQEERIEKQAILSMNQTISESYSLVASQNEELHKQAHDFDQHLSVLQSLQSEDIDNYLQDLREKEKQKWTLSRSGDKYIDAVFNSKLAKIQEAGIRLIQNYKLPEEISISPTDKCSIVMNQLQNAIDACEKISIRDQRWIRYTIDRTGDFIYLICENSIRRETDTSNIVIPRKEKHPHKKGYGLKIIKICAERNQGIVNFSTTDNSYICEVVLQVR